MEQLQLEPATLQPVDFSIAPTEYPESQIKRDNELQIAADVDVDDNLEYVRNQLDSELREFEMHNLYQANADVLVKEQADPKSIVEAMKTYRAVHGIPNPASSLEEAAANKEAEEAFAKNASTFMNSLLMPFIEDNGEVLAKANVVETGLQELEAHVAGDGGWKQWGKNAAYDTLVPQLLQTHMSKEMLEDLGHDYDGLSYTQMWTALLTNIDHAQATMNTVEFQQYFGNMVETVKRTSPVIAQDFVRVLREGVDKSKDIWALADVADIAWGVTRLAKGKSVAKMAKAAGNTARAKEEILDAFVEGKDLNTILEDAITTTAATPFPQEGIMSFAGKVKKEIAETLADSDAMAIVDRYSQNRLLTPDQIEIARTLEKEKLANKYADTFESPIDLVDVAVEETETGAYNAKFLVGTGIKGDAAMDDVAATLMAKRLGLTEDSYKLVKPTGEGLYLQVERPLKYDTYSIIGAESDKSSWLTRAVGRWVRGSTGMSKEAHEKITVAVRQYNAMRSDMTRRAEGLLRSMSKDEYKHLNSLMDVFRNDRRWWTSDAELIDAGCSESAVEFANLFRRMNDIDYIVHDNKVVNALRQAGYVVGEDARTIMKDVSTTPINLENFSKMVIKADDRYGAWTVDKLQKALKNKEVRLMSVHHAMGGNRDLQYSHMIVPAAYKTYEVPRFITNYVPGGRVNYAEGNWFIKAGTGFTKNGAVYNGFARTIKAVENRKEAVQYVEEANKAIDIFNDWQIGIIDDLEAHKQIVESNLHKFQVHSLDTLKDVKKHEDNSDWIIDPPHKLQVVGDGEDYIYDKGINIFKEGESEIDEALQDLIESLADRNTHRGEMLTKLNGEEATTLNLAESFNKVVNRAAKSLTTNDLETWFGQQFRRNYAHLVEGGKGLTDKQLLTAELKDVDKLPGAYKDEWRMAKNMQMRWDRLSNSMTDADKAVQRFMDELVNDILGEKLLKNIPVIGNSKLVDKTLEKLARVEPVKAATHLQFTASMGFYNISQLWKQGLLGSFNTFAMAPKEASKFMIGQPSIYSAMSLRMKGMTKASDECIKTAAKLTGYSEKDLSKFVDYAISMGSRDSIANKVGASSKKLSTKRLNQLYKKQYYFTEAGNNYNQMMADFAAFFQNTDKNFTQIAGIADDLFLNMTKSSESYLQTRMFGRLITQWLTYPMRLVEAMMPSSRLTAGQKARLAAMQMIGVGGVAGTFFGNEGQLWSYNTLRGAGMSDEVADIASSGVLHYIAKQYGVDIKEGAKLFDNISWVFDLVSEDNAKPLYILNSIIPASAIAGTANALFKTVTQFFRPEVYDVENLNFLKEIATVPHQVGGVRNIANALLAASVGKMYNSRRDILKDNAEWSDVGKYLLGFKPVEKDLATSMAMYYHKPIKFADDYYKEVLEPLQKRINDLQESNTPEDPHKMTEARDNLLKEYSREYWKAMSIMQQEFNSGPAVNHLVNKTINGFMVKDALKSNEQRLYRMNPNVVQYLKDYAGVK